MLRILKVLILTVLVLNSRIGFAYPKVQINTLIDFTQKDSQALDKEVIILNKLLSIPSFWYQIKKANFYCTSQRTYHSKRSKNSEYPKLKKDKHAYTSDEIHDLIWYGQDEIGQDKDGVLNLKLRAKDYPKNKNGSQTHGSTNSGTLIISSNRSTRIHSTVKGKYAAHLLHEYIHVLGFKHKHNLPSKNIKKCGGIDVPLRIQKIAEAIIKSMN